MLRLMKKVLLAYITLTLYNRQSVLSTIEKGVFMKKFFDFAKKLFKSITIAEYIIYFVSLTAIITSALLTKFAFDGIIDPVTLSASIIGVTAIILVSKGNPIGQGLTIVFSALYAIASFNNKLYGEMITYLGMSAPIAACALIVWIRHPANGNKSEVKVNQIKLKEYGLLIVLTAAITTAFFFILRELNTSQLAISTFSVATSFIASYLTARRSKFYAIGYALNDLVLIIIWATACFKSIDNLPICINFSAFFILDAYGFINWNRMERKQKKLDEEAMKNHDEQIENNAETEECSTENNHSI